MGRRRNWTQMGRDTFLKSQLRDCLDDVEQARANNSWVAVSNLRKQAIAIRTELDEMAQVEATADPEEEMTEGELVRLLIDSVRHLPVDQVEALARVVELRLGTASSSG